MTHENTTARLRTALAAASSSARLRAALSAGTQPRAEYVEALIERCAIEPDFYVRDMLTWALTRQDAATTVDLLLAELTSAAPQARSQALHTLSKIGDRRAWRPTTELVADEDEDVARAAWRAAAVLAPPGERAGLADLLATQFDRGDRDVQLSLSRAFAALGPAATSAIERAKDDPDDGIRAHAIATEWITAHPEEGFDAAIAEGQRIVALLGAPTL